MLPLQYEEHYGPAQLPELNLDSRAVCSPPLRTQYGVNSVLGLWLTSKNIYTCQLLFFVGVCVCVCSAHVYTCQKSASGVDALGPYTLLSEIAVLAALEPAHQAKLLVS